MLADKPLDVVVYAPDPRIRSRISKLLITEFKENCTVSEVNSVDVVRTIVTSPKSYAVTIAIATADELRTLEHYAGVCINSFWRGELIASEVLRFIKNHLHAKRLYAELVATIEHCESPLRVGNVTTVPHCREYEILNADVVCSHVMIEDGCVIADGDYSFKLAPTKTDSFVPYRNDAWCELLANSLKEASVITDATDE